MPRLIPIADQIAYAEREHSMYRQALPQMVADGRLTPMESAARLAHSEAVIESLKFLLPPNGRQFSKPLICHFETEVERNEFAKFIASNLKRTP